MLELLTGRKSYDRLAILKNVKAQGQLLWFDIYI